MGITGLAAVCEYKPLPGLDIHSCMFCADSSVSCNTPDLKFLLVA